MKKTVIILIILIRAFSLVVDAQSPQWQWAKSAGGGVGSDQMSSGLATDANGNVYMSGAFTGSYIVFGTDTLLNTAPVISFITPTCMFVTKYDALGNVLWARSAGAGQANGIATDAAGNAYVAGTFGLVKYDSSGNVVWQTGVSGANVSGVCTDIYSNVYVTGWFNTNTITFGSYVLYDSSGGDDLFIVKYDPSGNVIWASSNNGAGYGDNKGISISSDPSCNVYVTGTFDGGDIVFGRDTLYNTMLAALGPYPYIANIFTVKYDSSGQVTWARGAGGGEDEYVTGIYADASGNAYITGQYNGSYIIFGSDTFSNYGFNLFITKYNALGGRLWTKSTMVVEESLPTAICHDDKGYIYIIGSYSGDTMILGNVTVTGGLNKFNAFAAKLDSSGNAIWIASASNGDGGGIAVDAIGDVYISGSYDSIIAFGRNLLTCDSLSDDIFIAKLDTTLSTGIAHIPDSQAGIMIYPNPTSDKLNIANLPQSATLTIVDMTGRILASPTGSDIDVSALPPGMYCIRIQDSVGGVVRKFVKE